MKYYVYGIKSSSRNYVYVGMTNNIKRRLSEHNLGKNKTTRPYKPFDIILSEEYPSRIDARKREKYLKLGCGREYLKTLK